MLLTPRELAALPPLYSTEHTPTGEVIIHVKLFDPCSEWTWYVAEAGEEEGAGWVLWAYVVGLDNEWGYVSMPELNELRNRRGLPMERDEQFTPCPFAQIQARELRLAA